jgi:hypothetical protein
MHTSREGSPAMFDTVADETLRADIAVELENRGKPAKPTVGDTPPGAR